MISFCLSAFANVHPVTVAVTLSERPFDPVPNIPQ